MELKPHLDAYTTNRQAKTERAQKLSSSLDAKIREHDRVEGEIRTLEGQMTDVRRVLNDINGRLRSFGFHSFSLRATPGGKGYEVIRPDGSPARENLSEGERSFVTFLYFYHLIDGSHDASGITSDKVIVFDDPVSSMDSEVLFIVSTLIRSVCDRALRRGSHIRQVFVLTHNVYFHKEVTYGRGKWREKEGHAFWTVRKPDTETRVESHGAKNPITTSYQLLWDELGKDPPSAATVQNNIRRILEYYFQLLGGTRLKRLPDEFSDDDPDKAICMSMVSWIHDGSHSIADDIVYSVPDPAVVKKYLKVFRRIFEKTGHVSHYLMMCSDEMRADYEADALRAAREAVEEVPS